MSKSNSGLFHGTAGENAVLIERQARLQAKTQETVAKLIANTPGSKKKAVAVGAYDERTGKTVAAFAGEVPREIAPEFKKTRRSHRRHWAYGVN